MERNRKNLPPRSVDNGSGRESGKVLELIASWVELYAGNYGREPTPETGRAYRLGLSDLRPELLHKAFGSCLRSCTFWPTVAEVRAAYRIQAENTPATRRLEEGVPEWTAEQKQTWMEAMSKVAKKIDAAQVSEAELLKRRNEQIEKLKAKGAAK